MQRVRSPRRKGPRQIAPRVLSWASMIDDDTAGQAIALTELEFVKPHVALMPDAHFGMGSAVGTVIPTVGAIIPAAVGVDIGCGMIAARTKYSAEDIEGLDLVGLRDELTRIIPLSPGNYNRDILRDYTVKRLAELEARAETEEVDLSHSPQWREQLGSLGGGNHFIELCLDEQDRVWCFLHSGSRGVGNKIAQKHIRIAQQWCEQAGAHLPDRDSAYLLEGTSEFDGYMTELLWAQAFALANREEMMDRFVDQLVLMMGDEREEVEVERINAHHNYTEQVNIDGTTMWLTRKGAINAETGRPGLIPGSMGTRSYVTRGLGNEDAFWSAPHGAGRVLSRRAARKKFTEHDLHERMRGIVYRPGRAWIDEIPDAYKPIDRVMEDARDLVEIVHELRQILNVKGT